MTPMLLAELVLQAGVPPGVFNIVHGGKRRWKRCARTATWRGLLRRIHDGRYAGLQHGLPARQTRAMHDGSQNHAVVMPDANKDHA